MNHHFFTGSKDSSRNFVRMLSLLGALFLVTAGISQCPPDQDVDADGDGYYAAPNGDDCNDSNPDINPGAPEVCNQKDDNCDLDIDEGFDADMDGFTTCGGDCNDTNASINPDAEEVCDRIDNDCDGKVDENATKDDDADGFTYCQDCNDTNAAVYPGAPELCDELDNNCNGVADEPPACEQPVQNNIFKVVVPPETPVGDTIYLTGDLAELGAWAPDAVPMTWFGGRLYTAEVLLPDGASFEYKYTRGSWETVEKNADGTESDNRTGVATGTFVANDVVARWADLEPWTGMPVDHLVINEVNYDNPSTDFNEFIEVYNPTQRSVDLAPLALVFVNGSGMTEYGRVMLGEAMTLEPRSYLVVASGTVEVNPTATKILFAATDGNLQNGSPDGIALINLDTGALIDALCYEGPMEAVTIETNAGVQTYNLVEQEPTPFYDLGNIEGSLIRYPNGYDTDWAFADWMFTKTITPGGANKYSF